MLFMKKLIFYCVLFLMTLGLSASTPVVPSVNAHQIMIPVGKTGKNISLAELSRISESELEALTGRKMNFSERLSFKLSQKKMRKSIAEDGTINKKKYAKFFAKKTGGPEVGFHGLGFILGFFLGLIGVLLAYVINYDADKKNRVKWAWIGYGISVVITLIIVIAIVASLP